jgi:O-succinylhomoserine sulfhydrylase
LGGRGRKAVRGGLARTPYGEISEALFLNQSFAYESAQAADDRLRRQFAGLHLPALRQPTTQMFEDRLALLEGAEQCKSCASGMAAVQLSLMGLLRAGDHLVAGRALFGSCRWIVSEWLPRFGVETTYVDATDLEAWKNAVRPNTKAFLIESPANPLLEVTAIGPWPRSRTPPGRRWWSITSSPRRSSRSRSCSARTSSSIRPPSTSTARAGCWAGRSSARTS